MAFDREARPARPARGNKRRKVCQFHRYLRYASASADRGHQACPSDRSAALRHRLKAAESNQSTEKAPKEKLRGFFCHALGDI